MVSVNIPDNFISNGLKIGVLVIIVVMLSTFLKPSLTGNFVKDIEALNASVTSCQNVIDEQKNEIELLNDTLNIASSDVDKLSEELDECNKLRDSSNQDYMLLRNQYNKTREEFNSMKVDYNDYKKKLNESENAYQDVVKNSANTICCMKRVENPAIKYYTVREGSIKCLESGELELECP
ncbi:MAG: hypothetical protein ACLFUO_06940 [Candidatus Woesearchaeota archaeon]